MTAEFLLYMAINTLIVLAIAPLFVSLIKKVKAATREGGGRRSF
jgi:formate hydrogenlyase subunit 4